MMKKILIALVIVMFAFAAYVVKRPTSYSISRSAAIAAPVADVFAQVNDLQKMDVWSPWTKVDPAMKKSFEGPPSGVGAIQRWSGNKQAGEGSMTIIDIKDGEYVRYRLDFARPFKNVAAAEFTLKSDGANTIVTWSMYGEHRNIIERVMSVFIDCDKMIGGEFEKGTIGLEDNLGSA